MFPCPLIPSSSSRFVNIVDLQGLLGASALLVSHMYCAIRLDHCWGMWGSFHYHNKTTGREEALQPQHMWSRASVQLWKYFNTMTESRFLNHLISRLFRRKGLFYFSNTQEAGSWHQTLFGQKQVLEWSCGIKEGSEVLHDL